MGTGRGEAPSAECRAQSEAAGAWRTACGDVAPELCRLRYEAGLQALALKTAVDIAVEPVVREQSTAPPTTPAPAPSSVPPADTESPLAATPVLRGRRARACAYGARCVAATNFGKTQRADFASASGRCICNYLSFLRTPFAFSLLRQGVFMGVLSLAFADLLPEVLRF